MQSSTASTAVRYVYNGANILYEYEATGSTVARYTFGLGIDEPIIIKKGADRGWYHFDGLGSVTKMTNASQGVINSYTYDAWGEQVSRTVTLPQPFTYTSREYDSTADLYFYRARWYDYKAGRFLSKDSWNGRIVDPLSRNRYIYVRNNPVKFTDPAGLNWYGSYCGPGNEGGAPISDTDSCCQEHDECYDKEICKDGKKIRCEEDYDCVRECDDELCNCINDTLPSDFEELAAQFVIYMLFACD